MKKETLESLDKARLNYALTTSEVARINTRAGAVMFYETTASWQHRGRVFKGDVLALLAWLKTNRLVVV